MLESIPRRVPSKTDASQHPSLDYLFPVWVQIRGYEVNEERNVPVSSCCDDQNSPTVIASSNLHLQIMLNMSILSICQCCLSLTPPPKTLGYLRMLRIVFLLLVTPLFVSLRVDYSGTMVSQVLCTPWASATLLSKFSRQPGRFCSRR